MAATRRFATGDGINLDVGGNAAFTTDAFTFAAVFQQGADGTEFDLLRGWTSGFALLWSISTDTTTNRLTYTEAATGTRGQSAFTVTQADGWVLVAASKPAGTSTIVWSKYVFATKTWTQSNDVLGTVGTSAALGAGSHFQIAAATGGTGDYAGSALWSGVTFTNAQVQALAVSWHDWFAANPTAMWVLNQSATTFNIKDWVGASDQTFISGTTISPSSSPLAEAEPGPVLNRRQPARLSPASFPRVPYSADPLPDQVSRTSIYSISNFGSSLPAEWTGSGSTGSVEGVNASRLELTTGTLGTFTDYARADLTATGTTSMADVDGYVSFEITNPNAEQYITFYARASNDWANGDNPDTSIGFQLDYRGRPDIVHRFHTGTKTLIANSVTVNHVPMTNGALYWCHFRVIGDWVFCSWWSGLQTDEPKNGDGSFAWTQYGHQLLVPSAGMFKIINAGGTAAAAKNMYVHSVDIGTTVAGAGSASWTGSAAALTVTATVGSFAVTGSASWAGSGAALALATTSGSFSPTPAASWAGSGAAPTVTAVSGSFNPTPAASWTGSSAALVLAATSGSLTATGTAAPWVGSPKALVLAATSGSLTATGTASWAGSSKALTLAATSGTVGGTGTTTITGGATALTLSAASGSFTPGTAAWAGSVTALTLTAASGTFSSGTASLVGSATALTITATAGTFTATGSATWTGSSATVTLAAASGSFTASGTAAWSGSAAARSATAAPGSFAATGTASWAGASTTLAVTPAAGSLIAGGAPFVGTGTSLSLAAGAGSFTATGSVGWAGSGATRQLLAVPGSLSGTGIGALVGSTVVVAVTAASGAFTGTGPAAWVGATKLLAVTPAAGQFASYQAIQATMPLTDASTATELVATGSSGRLTATAVLERATTETVTDRTTTRLA